MKEEIGREIENIANLLLSLKDYPKGNYRYQISCFIKKLSPEYVKLKLDSIIHMHINRMFRTRQRIVECVIYNLLWRYYLSVYAIK